MKERIGTETDRTSARNVDSVRKARAGVKRVVRKEYKKCMESF